MKRILLIFLIAYSFVGNNKIVKNVYAKEIFRVGERMIYTIKWNGIRVGINILELKEIKKIKEYDTYHIVTETYTQGIINLFFKVKDRVETFVDTVNYYPWLYKKDINEGNYYIKAVYEFDHNIGIVDTPWNRYSIPKGIQDPLSILAYFRTLDFKVNDVFDLSFFSGKAIKLLRVNVINKESIQIPSGEFNTKVVSFSVGRQERTYLKTQVSMWVWFTDDDKKIPVFVKCNTSYGTITGTLIEYREGG